LENDAIFIGFYTFGYSKNPKNHKDYKQIPTSNKFAVLRSRPTMSQEIRDIILSTNYLLFAVWSNFLLDRNHRKTALTSKRLKDALKVSTSQIKLKKSSLDMTLPVKIRLECIFAGKKGFLFPSLFLL